MLSPLQPFRVRMQAPLSTLQGQTLRQCYQPIMGTTGLALYLSLADYAGAEGVWSPAGMHASLLDQLQVSPQDLTQARYRLEALGLLRSYQAKQVQGNQQTQLVSYELILPLDVGDFLRHPLYAALLMNQIGDQAFYRLMRRFEWQELDVSEYVEVTQAFSQVFDYPSDQAIQDAQHQEQVSGRYRQQSADRPTEEVETTPADDFVFGQVLDQLEAAGMDAGLFTRELRQTMRQLHQTYGFDENQVATVLKLAYQDDSGQLALKQLPALAQRYQQSLAKQAQAQTDVSQIKEQIHTRTQALLAQGGYSDNQARIIATAEVLPPQAFLKQVKQAKGGIRSDQERYNVESALTKVALAPAIVNLAVYYLLVMEGRDHLYKSNFEKLLDEWQQKGIREVSQVFRYIEDKRQAQAAAAEQSATRATSAGYRRGKGATAPHQEVVPSWLKARQQGAKSEVQQPESDSASRRQSPSGPDVQATQTFVNPFKQSSESTQSDRQS